MYYAPNLQRDYEANQERAQYLVERVAEQFEEDAERIYGDLMEMAARDLLKIIPDDLRDQVESAITAAACRIAGLS